MLFAEEKLSRKAASAIASTKMRTPLTGRERLDLFHRRKRRRKGHVAVGKKKLLFLFARFCDAKKRAEVEKRNSPHSPMGKKKNSAVQFTYDENRDETDSIRRRSATPQKGERKSHDHPL